MVAEDEIARPELRLLQVDNPIVLPINTKIRTLVTSSDVLHS
jgi:cytochrome c oxidase subunit 2